MNTSSTYNIAAPTWAQKASRLGYTRAYAEFLTNRAQTTGAVLDVGTGTGTFATAWIDAGGSRNLTLLDPSKEMLAHAKTHLKKSGHSPAIVNATFEAFQNETTYDVILASHVLEHFNDPFSAMARFSKMLSSGGYIYLTVSKPHWCNWLIWLRFRHRWYHSIVISKMAESADLTVVHVHRFQSGPPSRTSIGYIFSKP